MGVTDRAADRFELDVEDATSVGSKLRTFWLALVNVLLAGGAPANPGGRKIHVLDRATGQRLLTHVESFGEDQSALGEMRRDLTSLSPEEFLDRWREAGAT